MTRSLWQDTDIQCVECETVSSDITADVAIVGAGFTGLWTAYWLTELNPSLNIVIIEREFIGFGASGRNGGWFSALFPASLDKVARVSSRSAAVSLYRALMDNVATTTQLVSSLGLDCDWRHDGTYTFIRSHAQMKRAEAEIEYFRSWGFDEHDITFLPPSEITTPVTQLKGALFTPHCARVNPYKLVTGLAKVVQSRGVKIYENSHATEINPKKIRVNNHTIKAPFVIRATEAYTSQLKGEKRTVAPIYSFMIATDVLPHDTINTLSLRGSTFADLRNLVIYGQVTQDNRIAFGGRGAPYHFGSKISADFENNPNVSAKIFSILQDMVPAIGNPAITHQWAGVLGVHRDWFPKVGFDAETGFGYAGGYIGDGVGSSALAGETLAHLVTKIPTELTDLPWLYQSIKRWEIEPLRYLGISLGLRAMTIADKEESMTHRPSLLGKLMSPLIGH
ncbi:MAG: hypothetical protein RIS09_372 [Actinomycetota bacterium]